MPGDREGSLRAEAQARDPDRSRGKGKGYRNKVDSMLIAISAMHGRHEVSRAWAEHTASLGFKDVFVCVSEGDQESFDICQAYGFTICWRPNNPLSDKFNGALAYAFNMTNAARFMVLPSDDFVSREWVEAARNSTEDYIIPHTCAILDAYSQACYKIAKLSLNPGGTMRFGAGRVVSRKVVEACEGQLWPSELNKGLDSASHARISKSGFTVKVVETEGIPITDLKTEENLWPFRTWEHSGRP